MSGGLSEGEKLEIAVLGGGTAGFMAAVQLGRELPACTLWHIFDSRRPTIGVGESTTPAVPRWIEQQTGLDLAALRRSCDATVKRAGSFEQWGTRSERFLHRFQPTGELAVHLDAAKLATTLGPFVRGHTVDAFVREVRRDGERAAVELEGGRTIDCDLVVDARGFPSLPDPDCLSLDFIPTNTALVQFSTPLDCPEVTRNVARPHGWVFLIPLGDHTSVGYIYDRNLSSREQIEADLDELLAAEGGRPITPRRELPFPNFSRRTFFDGTVMRVGNAASFTEPLEALSIGTVVLQLRTLVQWIRNGKQPSRLASVNAGLLSYVRRNALFLAWHYAGGSPYRTPFWDRAQTAFDRARARPALADDAALFERFLTVGRDLVVDDLHTIADRQQWLSQVYGRLRLFRPFGNFSELNVAQVGHGIGYFHDQADDHADDHAES